MATYGNAANVRVLVGSPDTDEVSAALITLGISYADDWVKTALYRLYSTYIDTGGAWDTTVPGVVISIADHFAAYFVQGVKYKNAANEELDSELAMELYRFAQEMLDKIQKGEKLIPGSPTVPLSAAAAGSLESILTNPDKNYESIFNIDNSLAWAANPDLLDEIADNRG